MGNIAFPFKALGATRFERLWRPPSGVTQEGKLRGELTVPVSPTGSLADTVVYEQPNDPAAKLHLPRFRIRTSQTSYDIRIAGAAGRWSIRFGVEPFPAEELGDDARTPALPFSIPDAVLAYQAPPLERRTSASEIIPDAGGFTIAFDVDLPGKDEILWALASDQGLQLVLSRAFTAAVPVAETSPQGGGSFHLVGNRLLQMHVPVDPSPVDPLEPDPNEGFRAGVSLRGLETRVLRAETRAAKFEPLLIHKAFLAKPAPAVEAKPFAKRLRLNALDRLHDIAFDPGRVVVVQPPSEPAPEQRYRETPTVLPAEIRLRLQPDAHPSIFQGGLTQAPQFRTLRVTHPAGAAGRSHVYFQDEHRPQAFYYLPDRYCLARTESLPLRPAVVFRVEQGEEEGDTRTALTFRLRPVVDHDRLEAALAELEKQIPPPAAGEPALSAVLEPVQADSELSLGLPPGAELESPALDLINGFVAQVFFPFDQFQDIFAALASSEELGTVLRGNVDVAVDAGEGPRGSGHVLVPVDIRFSSAGGDVLTVDESPLAGGGVSVTIRNSSESPVRIEALPLRMTRGQVEVAALAEALSLPMELAAGAETTFEVTPAEPLPGEGDVDVLADLSAVVPLPDAQAILALTLDQRIAQMSARTVTVLTTPNKLAGGGDEVHDIFVEFEGGLEAPLHLNAAQLQAEASVPVPLVDVLLRRDSAPYRFRQTILRASGDQRDAEWRSSDASLLVVPVV